MHVVLSTEDGSRGVAGRVTAPLADALSAVNSERRGQAVCLRADADDARGGAPRRRSVARPCDVSLEQVMGCGMGGCYSCVVLTRDAGHPPHFVRSCLEGPASTRGANRVGGVEALMSLTGVSVSLFARS